MNFSKKLLALFLLFFIPVFGINNFNVVNNKQNKILIGDCSIKNPKTDSALKIDSLVPMNDIDHKIKYDPVKLKATEYFDLNYSLDTSSIPIENVKNIWITLSHESGGHQDYSIHNLDVELKNSEPTNGIITGERIFPVENLDIATEYEYLKVDIVGNLEDNTQITSSFDVVRFETGDPYVEPVTTINASSIKTNSVHLDFKLTNDDWIKIESNDIELNLYKKVGSEYTGELVEPIEFNSIDKSNYYADLTGLKNNTDYYINGSVNFTKSFDQSSSQSINIDNYDFKTLIKPWYEKPGWIIGIITILLLLIMLISIMIWYFAFYRVEVKKKN